MEAQDLRAKSESDLHQQLGSLLKEQFNLRMQKGTGQAVSPHELRRLRRDIARVKTVLSEKSRKGEKA